MSCRDCKACDLTYVCKRSSNFRNLTCGDCAMNTTCSKLKAIVQYPDCGSFVPKGFGMERIITLTAKNAVEMTMEIAKGAAREAAREEVAEARQEAGAASAGPCPACGQMTYVGIMHKCPVN